MSPTEDRTSSAANMGPLDDDATLVFGDPSAASKRDPSLSREAITAATPSLHTFGVLDVQTANFIDWLDTREEAEASVQHIRDLNPDMPASEIEIVEFNQEGMPV